METAKSELRRQVSFLAAILVSLWTGYFLCHTRQTANALELTALAVVLVAAAATARLKVRPRGAPGRLALGGALAAAAAGAGLATGWPVPHEALLFSGAVAAYVGLGESVGGREPVSRAAFAAVLGAMVTGMAALALAGFARPHGLVGVAVLAWLAIRTGWYGSGVLRERTAARQGVFSQNASAATGLLAAAVLVFRIPEGRPELAELTWPLVAAAFSVVLVRLAPHVVREE